MIYASSSQACKYIDDLVALACANPCGAIEWDLNFIPPTLDRGRRKSTLRAFEEYRIDCRYHLPHSSVELAHGEAAIRDCSMRVLTQCIGFVAEMGGDSAVIHIDGFAESPNDEFALEALSGIARHAATNGVQLFVETLGIGATTRASFLEEAAEIDNVGICLDVGHVNQVSRGNARYREVISALLPRCGHAHVYRLEDSRRNHVGFGSLDEVRGEPLVAELMSCGCGWLTMELDSIDAQVAQIGLLQDFEKEARQYGWVK